ncbi:MAG TPA: DUF3667 domain-containing protein [Cyclobacteriaceae bacterium]|nr:DUF3667 domain-containing protein [Cyclobacteriaceae bacterium]
MRFLKRRPDTFDYALERTCVTCGTIFHGRYCNRCGEKVVEPHERTLIAFLDGVLNAFTFLEGKFFRSIKLLISKPGQLSRNIANGNQVPYMRMLNLFFVANFFYFFFTIFDAFNSSLYTQMNFLGSHSETVREMVKARIQAEHIDIEAFRKSYGEATVNLSKLLIISLTLGLTGIFWVFNFSRKRNFADYMLASLEFYTFYLLFLLVILANAVLFLIRGMKPLGYDWNILLTDDVFSSITKVLMIWFLFNIERNFFGNKWYWAIPKAIAIYWLIGQTVHLYRMGLFYITFYTM